MQLQLKKMCQVSINTNYSKKYVRPERQYKIIHLFCRHVRETRLFSMWLYLDCICVIRFCHCHQIITVHFYEQVKINNFLLSLLTSWSLAAWCWRIFNEPILQSAALRLSTEGWKRCIDVTIVSVYQGKKLHYTFKQTYLLGLIRIIFWLIIRERIGP